MVMIACTIAAPIRVAEVQSCTNDWSIFSTSTGKRLRWLRLE